MYFQTTYYRHVAGGAVRFAGRSGAPAAPPLSARRIEQLIAVIQAVIFLPAHHHRHAAAFLDAIPIFHAGKDRMPEHEEGNKETSHPKVVDLPVPVLILDKAPDLPVDQAVELGNQYDMVPILPVLGKKRRPFLTFPVIPAPAVKNQLAFVNNDPGLSFDDMPTGITLMAQEGKVNQPSDIKLMIVLMEKMTLPFRLHGTVINIKVGNDVLPPAKLEEDVLCNMVALARTGSAGI